MAVFTIEVDFGGGFVDISAHCDGLVRQRRLHKNLKPTVNTARWTVKDITTANLFNTTVATMPVRIQKDAADWFIGQVRPTYRNHIHSTLRDFKVEAVDNTIDLQKQIDDQISYTAFTVSNPGTPATSIMHQLFLSAGFVLGDLNFPTISNSISRYTVERQDERSYWNEATAILFEFGYVFDAEPNGNITLRHLHPTALVTSPITDDDIYQPMEIRRQELRQEAVRVEWNPVTTIVGALVFSDKTGGDATNRMNVALALSEYYPPGASAADSIFAEYRIPDGDLLAVDSPVLTHTNVPNVSLARSVLGVKRADVAFLGGTGGGTLTRFDITGDAVFKDKTKIRRSVVYKVVGSDKIMEVKTRFIESTADANQLSSDIANWLDFARFLYTFPLEHTFAVDLNDELALTEDVMSITTDLRVVELTEDDDGRRTAICEGISAYSLQTDEEQGTVDTPPATLPIRDDPLVLTKPEDQDGYTGAGGTVVPTVPTAIATAEHRTITVNCDVQGNLTNFDRFEWQVSDDDATWFAPRFDGVDWKAGAGADHDTDVPVLIHTAIPLTGTEDIPTDLALFYRVRRVTKAPLASAYSASTTASSKSVISGELDAESVTGKKVQQDVLRAVAASGPALGMVVNPAFTEADQFAPTRPQGWRIDRDSVVETRITVETFDGRRAMKLADDATPYGAASVKFGVEGTDTFRVRVRLRGATAIGTFRLRMMELTTTVPTSAQSHVIFDVTPPSYGVNADLINDLTTPAALAVPVSWTEYDLVYTPTNSGVRYASVDIFRDAAADDVYVEYAFVERRSIASDITPSNWVRGISDEDLVAYWSLDDAQALDHGPSGFAPVIGGSPTPVPAANANGLRFDAPTEDVRILTDAEADGIMGADFTVSLWFKSEEQTTGQAAARVIDRDVNTFFGLRVDQSAAYGSQAVALHIAGDFDLVGVNVGNELHHVALGFDNSQTFVYVDAVLVYTHPLGWADFAVATQNVFLANNSVGASEFTGVIDEVRIYSRLLDLGEIEYLFHNPGGAHPRMVTADRMVANSVTTLALDAFAVTAAKILAGAITTLKLAAGAVTADKINTAVLNTQFAAIREFLMVGSGTGLSGYIGTKEVFQFTTVADVAGSLGGKYVTFSAPTGDYYAWIDVDNGSSDPMPAGRSGIEVDISANDTANAVATALAAAINASSEFTAPVPGANVAIVTVTKQGNVTDAANVDAGFTAATNTQGSDVDTPVLGDQRTSIDGNELLLALYTTVWQERNKLGGDDADGVFERRALLAGIRSASAPPAKDEIPHRNWVVFDFEDATDLLRDSYGTDHTTAAVGVTSVVSPVKFGSRAIRINTTGVGQTISFSSSGSTSKQTFLFFGWEQGGAWRDFSWSGWVRFDNVSTDHEVFNTGPVSSANNRIILRKTNATLHYEVKENSATPTNLLTHSVTMTISTYHHISFVWDDSALEGTLIVDGVSESGTVTTGPSTHASPNLWRLGHLEAVNTDYFFDDFGFVLDVAVADAPLVRHYDRGVPWASGGVTENDISLAMDANGRALIPFGNDGSGFRGPHGLTTEPDSRSYATGFEYRFRNNTTDRPTILTATAQSVFTKLTPQSGTTQRGIPYGVRALIFKTEMSDSIGNVAAYFRRPDETVAFGILNRSDYFNHSSATSEVIGGEEVVECNSLGQFEYVTLGGTLLTLVLVGFRM